MKKLLVLALVLSVASLANAGLMVTMSSATVAPGGTVTLSIGTDATAINTAQGMALVTASGTISILTDVDGNPLPGIQLNPPMDGTAVFGSIFNDAVGNGVTGLAAGENGVGAAVGFDGGSVAANTIIWTNITFTAPQTMGPVVVRLAQLDDQFANAGTYNSQTITVTPEPATLAILGLGALLLRRK